MPPTNEAGHGFSDGASNVTPVSLSPGTRLGPYEVLSPLGAGGMGEVYRARDERLERDVEIKVLPVSFSASHEAVNRSRGETRWQPPTSSSLRYFGRCLLVPMTCFIDKEVEA